MGENAKNFSIVSIENIIDKLIRFVISILIARKFGMEAFGLFAFTTVSISFIVLFMDFSLSNSVIVFSNTKKNSREVIFGLYVIVRLVIFLAFVVLFLGLPSLFLQLLVNSYHLSNLTTITFPIIVACFFESMQYIIAVFLQSMKQFRFRFVLNTGIALLRLLLILFLFILEIKDIQIFIWVYALASLPVIIICPKYIVKQFKLFLRKGISQALLKEIIEYSKWIFAGSIIMNVMSRIDYYFVAAFISIEEAGIYNIAVQLISIFAIFRIAYGKVFLPVLAEYRNENQFRRYIKKVNRLILLLALCIIIFLPFSSSIVKLAYGEDFFGASYILQVLLFSYFFTMWNVMIGQIMYSLGHSRIMAYGALIKVLIFSVTGIYIIPLYAGIGAAISISISSMVYLVILLIYLRKVVNLK